MALKEFEQPEIIEINNALRLRKYDGHYGLFLPGYQNPVVYNYGSYDDYSYNTYDYSYDYSYDYNAGAAQGADGCVEDGLFN